VSIQITLKLPGIIRFYIFLCHWGTVQGVFTSDLMEAEEKQGKYTFERSLK